jgi:hypothetical protein
MLSSVPISPPVTPKALILRDRSSSPEEALQLPPALVGRLSVPSSPPPYTNDIRRKSNARRYSRAMATADKDAITFRDPFSIENNYIACNRTKSTPQRSPSPSTRGSFTMDILQDICGVSKSWKRRNMDAEPTVTQNQPAFNTTSILNTERHVKKAKTDAAAAYDKVDITLSDQDIFTNPQWIPDMDVFENLPSVRVVWKGNFLFY